MVDQPSKLVPTNLKFEDTVAKVHVPSTRSIREAYSLDCKGKVNPEQEAEFDAWLAQYSKTISERVWDKAVLAVSQSNTYRNPYRDPTNEEILSVASRIYKDNEELMNRLGGINE